MKPETRRRYCPDLSNHMAECDCNYLRLVKLFPGFEEVDEIEIGVRPGECGGVRVLIRVDERFRYTTTMTVLLSDGDTGALIRWPSIQVRLYHDLRTAEVKEYQEHRQFEPRYEYPNSRMYYPDEKVQVNRFLGEMLTHCLAHGHSLVPVMQRVGAT